MADRDERLEDSDPFRQLRYLPLPYSDRYHTDDPDILQPQPVRPSASPAYLGGGPDPYRALGSFSVREGLFGQRELSPGARYFALIENQLFQRQTPRFPSGRAYWRFGDPIPAGWRVMVTPHMANSPRPEQHHVLVPDHNTPVSYERRRIPLSVLLAPDCTVVEHAAILHSMRNSDTQFAPIGDSNTMSGSCSTGEDAPAGPADPHAQNPSEEATVPEAADKSEDLASVLTMEKEVVLCEFEELATHTAKCDVCNKRNTSGMSRCLTCGWQTCNPCTIARGYFRTHHVNGNIHTGLTSQSDLDAAAEEISKSKKKKTSTPKKKATGSQSKAAGKPKKGRPAKKRRTPKKAPKTASESSPVAKKYDADQEILAEDLNAPEDRKTQNDQDVCDVDSIFDADATEDLPEDDLLEDEEWTPLRTLNTPLKLGKLYSQAIQQAHRGREDLHQKASTEQKVEPIKVADADKLVSKSKVPKQTPERTKAQTFCRKQPGRCA
ncbi:hypothetical protein BDV23DRAFT_181833 [Aspergillus alliaceus]|uniref:Uncharacterized protein n=1 Tax=Petromyces alliaceus TaxID=209559 RepID=A0A5N7CE22_PETAA|nr:hypothetical protein BDV23DRAFT_181833 [Aspergillus alliaceus]